ncbi:SDR family NAD(P)-dependent oxidoreductase [Streptomyces sp. LP05-1]|uniref:SDR family NAD(P)-dependent oxidoreductase n=1 Tax=Streptomyces pyxinae TaxID=2970734 RepID=A0ABT2CJZ5_9ACTN|nr:type I polyketide synthase [Streptomyces sp. LP05-1]MCS0636904.1 SDR family NAD(P)-dependent oxidoreductase [Streptomyces sp. LP05-1]
MSSVRNAPPQWPIAVVGAACRLPGGIRSLDELWTALEQGRDAITEVPADRFDQRLFVDPAVPRPGKSYTAAGGFLDDVTSFDAGYFGISPKEAGHMDPHHRLLLELTAEALDDAAIDPARWAGTDTAVYVGISDSSYAGLRAQQPRGIGPYTMVGTASSIAANRISHSFDLRGPSMAVDTACSSSLVAFDRACRTLWDGTSRTAVVGGANMLLGPFSYIGFSQASMLSPRGRCAPFAAGADGFVRAEGGGVVLLKPLADAVADGDRVHAVVLGSGTNSDGRTPGIALPNPHAQEDLLRQVYARAGVHPDELVYFEAHGTGTAAGDPLEAGAIGHALGVRRITGELPMGSVKSNLGHLEPASGMAGLCKALLVLRHRRAPASLLPGEIPHPDIDFTGLGLQLPEESRPLAASGRAVVGINSFGFGGSNAHVVLAAPPEAGRAVVPDARRTPAAGTAVAPGTTPVTPGSTAVPSGSAAAAGAAPEPDPGQAGDAVPPPVPGSPGAASGEPGELPVLVSARTPAALGQALRDTAERLAGADARDFYDLAYTSCVRRGRHPHRAVVLARTPAEAARQLAGLTAPGAPAAPAGPGAETGPGAPAAPAVPGAADAYRTGDGASGTGGDASRAGTEAPGGPEARKQAPRAGATALVPAPAPAPEDSAGGPGAPVPAAGDRTTGPAPAAPTAGSAAPATVPAPAAAPEDTPVPAAGVASPRPTAGARIVRPREDGSGTPPGAARGEAVARGTVALVFTGNGAHWPGMGADLFARDTVFREAVAAVDAELAPLTGWSVAGLMARPAEEWRLGATEVAQPVLFALQAGLVAVLAAHGTRPAMVLGHSVGEIAAAHAAGVLTLAQAARVVAVRSAAQATTAGTGRMAAVGLPADEARAELAAYGGLLEIAAVNSEREVTVAGEPAAMGALAARAAERGWFFRNLGLDYAFHSAAMDPVRPAVREPLAGLAPAAGTVPFYSTVTGARTDGTALDAEYWWRNVREPVRFSDAADAALADGADVFLEVGPHPALRGYLRTAADRRPGVTVAVLPTLRRGQDGPRRLATTRAALLACGARTDWDRYFPRRGRVAELPAYPWQRERHWEGSPHVWVRTSGDGTREHPLLGERLPAPHPTWNGAVEPVLTPWLADHRIAGSVVVPATGYVELALAAGRLALDAPVEVEHLDISNALVLPWPDAGGVRVQTTLRADDGALAITSLDEQLREPRGHVRARVRKLLRSRPAPLDPAAARERCPELRDVAEIHRAYDLVGLQLGPSFRVLETLRTGAGRSLASYRHEAPGDPYTVHPGLLDGALQAGVALLVDRLEQGHAYLPATIEAVRVWGTPAQAGLIEVTERSRTDDEVCWDLLVTDASGAVTAQVEGCRLRRAQSRHRGALGTVHTELRAAPHPGPVAAPGPLPEPARLLAGARERIDALRADWRELSGGGAAIEAQKEWLAHGYGAAVAELFTAPGDSFDLDLLVRRGLPAHRRRLLGALAPLLERYGLWRAEPGGGRWTAAPLPARGVAEAAYDYLLRHPAFGPGQALAQHQLSRFTEESRSGGGAGKPAVSESANRMLEQWYDTAPAARFQHRLAQALVERIVAAWPADRALRVLEIGAGPGSTAAALLPLLPAERTRYHLTDLSAAALSRAETRLAAHDFVSYAPFDLDADPAGQGLDESGYDVVIAAHALHTAADPRAALRRVRALLAPGGQLLAVESHDTELYAALTGSSDGPGAAALTDHEPREPRPYGGLLAGDSWLALLADCGFTGAVHTGDDPRPAHSAHSVLLAARPAEPAGAAGEAPGTGGEPAAAPGAGRPGELPAAEPGTVHLVVAEDDGERPLADALAALLTTPGTGTAAVAGGLPESPGAWADRLTAARESATNGGTAGAASGPAGELVLTVLLGEREPGGPGAGDPAADGVAGHVAGAARRLAALGALASASQNLPGEIRLRLVTRECGAVPGPDPITHPQDAAVWGGARTLANEHPGLGTRRIALRRTPDPTADAGRLARELLTPTDEDEVVLTAADRFVPREKRSPRRLRPAGERPYELTVRDPGLSYRLVWRERAEAPAPGPGELLVRVRAAALNYRDIMESTGLLPGEMRETTHRGAGVGLECAGEVLARGPGVRRFAPGDRVTGMAPGALASHVVIHENHASAVPGGMSFAAATTVPVAHTTVRYALDRLARLAPGETVLVHGAAGGVGLMAVHHARRCGARVIATAGSELKRDFLRGLGVEHVLDSRTLDFAERARELTGGRGVDVVLNSLAGEAIGRGLELLRPGGRFVELGKRDFFENRPLSLRPFTRNIAFFGVDISKLSADDPALVEMRSRGVDTALPYTVFPAARITEAFHLLQHSQQIGKVVVTLGTLDEPVLVEELPEPPRLDPEGSYLITGGTSGFGAATAHWLADLGARRLALVSRRGAEAPEAAGLLRELAARGVEATAYAADVTDAGAVRRLLDAMEAGGHPVRGVVHAAMHLDDDELTALDAGRVAAVLAPKMGGAEVLDRVFRERGDTLDLFLLYSSGTTTVGNLKQASYVAANLFLEALARQRRQRGLPGLALAWGAIADAGYVERNDLAPSLAAYGMEAVTAREAFAAAGELLSGERPFVGVARADWSKAWMLPLLGTPRLRGLAPARSAGDDEPEDLLARFAALPPEEALAELTRCLTDLLAEVLHLEPGQIDPYRRLDEYGLDSLMATQALVTINQRYGVDIPPMELLRGNGTADEFARVVQLRLGLGGPSGAAASVALPAQPAAGAGAPARPAADTSSGGPR